MQDFLIEFASRTNLQVESFRSEQKRNNSLVQSDIANLKKQLDESINDCTKTTSDELTYTNKIFNTQIAESESKLLNQNNQLLNILIEISNKNNFQFESVKECCIVQSNNMKSIIGTLQKIINTSFYDLENSNRQSLEVIGNSLTRLMENLRTESAKLEKDEPAVSKTAGTEKSFKMIKNYFDQQKMNTMEEKMLSFDTKLNRVIDLLNKTRADQMSTTKP